jgi:phosphate transport system substrate-binding protein
MKTVGPAGAASDSVAGMPGLVGTSTVDVLRPPEPAMIMSPARQIRIATILACALLVGAPVARAEDVLRVSGSGSWLGAMSRLAPAFAKANPGARLEVVPSLGSSGAMRALGAGELEVALSGRPLKADERGRGLTAVEVARTPFVFAAGPGAGVTGLTAAELVRILKGEQAAWPNGEQIWPVLRPANDADTAYLRSLSPALSAALTVALARPGQLMAPTNQQSDELVARHPGGLGMSTLAQLTTEPRGLTALAWEGVAPSLATLATGKYPLVKPLFLVLPARPSTAERRFLTFLATPEARRLLEAAGAQPLAFTAPR